MNEHLVSNDGTIAYLMHGSQNLADTAVKNIYTSVSPTATAMLASLVALVLIGLAWKKFKSPSVDLTKEIFSIILKVTLISAFIKNWDLVEKFIVDLFVNQSSGLATVICQALVGKTTAVDLPAYLEDVLSAAARYSIDFMATGSWMHPMPYVLGILVLLLACGAVIKGVLEIVVAQIIMAFMIGLFPIMLLFKLFAKTEKLFENYMGVLVGSALTVIFVAGASVFAVAIIGAMIPSSPYEVTFFQSMGVIIAGFIGYQLVCMAASKAQNIGGMIVLGSSTSHLVANAASAANLAKNINKASRGAGAAGQGLYSGAAKGAGWLASKIKGLGKK